MTDINEQIIKTLKKHGVKKAALFGSYSRNEHNSNSDIDLLIAPPKNMNLITFIGLKQTLEDQLNIKIDLVSENALKPTFRKYIEKDLKILINES